MEKRRVIARRGPVKHTETARHHEAFEVWYEADRDFDKVGKTLTVSRQTVYNWADWFGWAERADRRDSEVQALAARQAIKRKADLLKRQQRAGELMTRRGVEWFAKNEIGTAKDATAAVKTGIELERQAEGLPDWVVEILNAPEEQLTRRFDELDSRRRAAMAGIPDSPGDALSVLAGPDEEE